MLRTLALFSLLLLTCLAAHEGSKVAVLELKPISLAPQTTVNFTLRNLDRHKSLMITLQDHKLISLAEFKLHIENNNHDKTECHFKYSTNLCVLEIISEEVIITIECMDKNCSSTLILSQHTLVKLQHNQQLNRQLLTPGEVFKMQPSNFTSMLKVYSRREQHQLLAEQIAIFSNVHAFHLEQIEELDSISVQFGLKSVKTETEQYLFVDTGKVSKNQDLKVSLHTQNGQLYESEPIVDFIQTFGRHSKNKYIYAGRLWHNMQLNLRVFAPRDNSTFPLGLTIHGSQSNNTSTNIRNLHIPNVDFRGQKFYDLSFIVSRSQHSKHSTISIEVSLDEVNDRAVFIQVEVKDVQNAQITVFDNVFFGIDKNQQITLDVEPQIKLMLSQGDKDIKVLINTEQNYSVSTQLCSLMKGCQIIVKTQNRCESCSLQFDLSDETVHNNVLYHEVQGDAIEGKVDVDEQIFFRYALASRSTIRVLVESVNVILYANLDSYERCTVPKPNCHQYVVNQHNPITITSPDDQPSELLVSVLGLEKTSFKVQFLLQRDGLVLKLGQKFIYLFDNEQNSIVLKFVLDNSTFPTNSDYVSFTLVAPLGALKLEVKNIDGLSLSSVDGFLVFPRKDMTGDLFEVTISKMGKFTDDFIHLTLIASVDGSTVRLDITNTHYEKYEPGAQKKFILEYEPGQTNALNIFTEDLEKSKSNMTLTVREVNDHDSFQPLLTKIIKKDFELLNLNELLEYGDTCNDLNCELEISIVNSEKQALEQSITQLASESVISLSDSIWSGFQINELTRTNHFYFVPHAANRSTTVIFQTDDTHLYINYRIHNTSTSINPQDWPFLHSQTETVGHIASSQFIDIPANNSEMQTCWPTCVLLINLNELHTDNEDITKEHSLIQTYKILATNSIIELPQDTKLEFALARGQEKSLFIRVANFMESPSLTFFTYFAVGQGKLTASLVSGNQQFALGPNNGVLGFDYLQTTLPMYLVNSLISSNDLKENEVLLKISILAQSNLKMTVQFSCSMQDIYKLKIDDLQIASLQESEEVWYEFVPERDFFIKFYRIRGFPYLKVMRCDKQDYLQCLNKQKAQLQTELQHMLQSKEMVKSNDILTSEKDPNDPSGVETMIQKTYEVEYEHCENCIFFVWIYCFEGDLKLSINVRTRYSEVELKQQNIVNQRIQPQSHNSYLINAVPQEETIITIRILEGSAKIQVADRFQILFNETLNSVDDDYRDISLPPNALPKDKEEEIESIQNEDDEINRNDPYSLSKVHQPTTDSVLRHIHVTVTTTSEIPVQFLLSYSVGESSLYLQDGMVIQKRLQPNSPHTFYYHNLNRKSHAYLTLSSQIQPGSDQTDPKNELVAHFYYYPNANQRSQREQFTPQLPPSRNQNYLGNTDTRVYQLPTKFQLMQLQLSSKYNLRITASINHKQLIYLPLGYDYLIKLHLKEHLYLVVNRPNTDYLELKIRKCDQSLPSLYYTNDAKQFKKGMFTTEVDIENANFKQYIKTKSNSKTIHLKIIGDDSSDSIITITVSAATEQKQKPRFQAGNKGFLNYQMMSSNEVDVTFKPITCEGKQCLSPVIYYLLLADNIQDIFGELNCAGNRFVSQADTLHTTKRTEVITINQASLDKVAGDYHYKVNLDTRRAYIGLKAVVMDTVREQIVYIPLQISSLFGELDKVSTETLIITGVYTVIILAVIVALSTRFARRGYRPIASEE